jgi:tetratricopeptide (TPR) repeat protein
MARGMNGWVYVASVPHAPGFLKIKHTVEIEPNYVIDDLSVYNDGPPSVARVEYAAIVENAERLEREIHLELLHCRERGGWFRCDREDVIEAIRKCGEISYEENPAERKIDEEITHDAHEALILSTEPFGPNNPAPVKLLHKLARYSKSGGRLEEAGRLYERALEIVESKAPEKDIDLVYGLLCDLGEVYQVQGRLDEAEPLYKRAMEIAELETSETDTHSVLYLLWKLGRIYRAKNRYDEAERFYKKALAIAENTVEFANAYAALSLSYLAALSQVRGRQAEAETLYQRSLGTWEKAFNAEQQSLREEVVNRALLHDAQNEYAELVAHYKDQGRYSEIEMLYQRLLAIWEKDLGPENPSMIDGLRDLARVYQDQGKCDEAERCCRRALEIEGKRRPRHLEFVRSLLNQADIYKGQGKWKKARALYKKALPIMEEVLGPEHPDLDEPLNNLADIYKGQGKCSYFRFRG